MSGMNSSLESMLSKSLDVLRQRISNILSDEVLSKTTQLAAYDDEIEFSSYIFFNEVFNSTTLGLLLFPSL